jgi:hypothetical protein
LTRTLQIIWREDEEEAIPDLNALPVPKPKKMRDVYLKIHNASETMYTDQPGQFPVTSSSGNQYIMVLDEVDRNYRR